jgi:NADPH-dependent curcumin reductase CurA
MTTPLPPNRPRGPTIGRPATNRLPSAIPTPVSGQLLLEIQYLSLDPI